MKKAIKIAMCALALVGLVACSTNKKEPETVKDVPLFEVPNDWKVLSFDEAETHWDDDKAVMVYSFTDCPHCAVVVPALDELQDSSKTDIAFYYVDVTRDERTDGNNTYDRTIEHFTDYLDEDQVMYVPFIVYINGGKVLASHIGDVGNNGLSIEDTLSVYLARLINA